MCSLCEAKTIEFTHSNLYKLVKAHPGVTAYGLGKLTHKGRAHVAQKLVSMDAQGYLLCEGEHGDLYVYEANDA